MTVTPLTPNVGAEITGMSGSDFVNRRAADDCRAALAQYGVLVYRDANIPDQDLVAFSRLLGDVVPLPMGGHERPEIGRASCRERVLRLV